MQRTGGRWKEKHEVALRVTKLVTNARKHAKKYVISDKERACRDSRCPPKSRVSVPGHWRMRSKSSQLDTGQSHYRRSGVRRSANRARDRQARGKAIREAMSPNVPVF